MSQNDMSVANADGATVRADINSALQALASLSSGASAPGTTYAYQLWADTTTGLLKIRNAANSAWIVVGTLASVGWGIGVKNSFSANKNGTGQSGIADSTYTKVTFTTEEWDTGSYYDAANSKFQPTQPGKWLISACISNAGGQADQKYWRVAVYKNGVAYKYSHEAFSGNLVEQDARISVIVDFNGTTDYVEIYAYSDAGSATTISGDVLNTYLQGQEI
jgi:hypothetical protein